MTISNALRKDLSGGQWTRKVLTKTATERFTPANEQYTEAYIAEIQSKDPLRLKFMDEAGFALSEAVRQNRSTEGCSKLKRSVDMTSSGENGLNIRTNASPKWDRTRCPEE